MPQWTYYTEIIAGNFHRAVEYLNECHSEWDVVTMTISGNYTIVVYRLPIPISQDFSSCSIGSQSAAAQSAAAQLYLLIH